MHVTGFYLYLAQSFCYSMVAVVAAYPLLKIWRIRDPGLRFNFHLLTLLLPVVLPALFSLLYPARYGLNFRDRVALLDLRQWLELSLWGQLRVEHLLLIIFAASTVLFLLQEVFPLVTRPSRKSGLHPIEHGRFPVLDEALRESSTLMSHPTPPVMLLESTGPETFIKGVFRPTLVVSTAVAASAGKEELTAILCHEMAHLARRDHWTGWALVLVRGLAFYNPIAWFTSRLMWQENEQLCDFLSAKATGNPVALASALVDTAEQNWSTRLLPPPGSDSPPQGSHVHMVNSHLAFRVRRLLEHQNGNEEWGMARLFAFALMLTALLFFVA